VGIVSIPFTDLSISDSYASVSSQLLTDFYIPLLQNASTYNRAAGFFSSGIFTVVEAALSEFVQNGGVMRLICSPRLERTDFEAISNQNGLDQVSSLLMADLNAWDASVGNNSPSSLLRRLLSRGALDIRIAVPRDGYGIFHEKTGVFNDRFGNQVAFNGSVNETFAGWSCYGNQESFEVFRSWDHRDEHRVSRIARSFEEYWSGLFRGVKILTPDRLPEVFLPRESDIEEEEAVSRFMAEKARRGESLSVKPKAVSTRPLMDHQKLAVKNWNEQGKRGIIDFVTGGGKTITAISIIQEWIKTGSPAIVLVPSEILVNQWISEIKQEIDDPRLSIIQVGAGENRDRWVASVRHAVSVENDEQLFVIVGTYQSARTDAFRFQIERAKSEILLVADEVHEIGSPDSRKILQFLNAEARLGLSATPERYGDPEGTDAIFGYFGKKVDPHFGIKDAIKAKRLVEYFYSLRTVFLNDEEDEKFEKLSQEIKRRSHRDPESSTGDEFVKKLLRDRANIVKQAQAKSDVPLQILENDRSPADHWLVYCDRISQISEVAQRLKSADISPLIYHSKLKTEVRETILNNFSRRGGVLLSVKCLDQGVDIPSIDAAIFLASSTNPREYIQRRGRVLRKSDNKNFAYLHDVVTLRPDGTVALKSDISRVAEIASNAINGIQAMVEVEYLADKSGLVFSDLYQFKDDSEEFELHEDEEEESK
jgi:superfamily II DNA or RNA helicase